jgi:hypothetical protein
MNEAIQRPLEFFHEHCKIIKYGSTAMADYVPVHGGNMTTGFASFKSDSIIIYRHPVIRMVFRPANDTD